MPSLGALVGADCPEGIVGRTATPPQPLLGSAGEQVISDELGVRVPLKQEWQTPL